MHKIKDMEFVRMAENINEYLGNQRDYLQAT